MSGGYNRFRDEALEGLTSIRGGIGYRQYQAAILAALAGTAAGTYDGWVMAALNFLHIKSVMLRAYFYITNVSALIGALIAGYLLDKIGRKATLILVGAIMLPVWVLFSYPNVWTVSVGSALGGLAAGGASVAVPVYIAELSEDSIRGTLGTFFYLQFISGELITFLGGMKDLTTTSAFAVLVTIIFLITFVWMPESPYFLASNGQQIQARKSIEFFRGPSEHIEEEVTRLQEASTKKILIKDLWKEDNVMKPILTALGLMVFSRLLALDGFNFRLYKSFMYSAGGREYMMLFGFILIVQVIGITIAAFFIDRLGRRLLLFVSSIGMCISIIFSSVLLLHHHKSFWAAFAVFGSYIGSFSIGLGPVPWVIAGELLPIQHKTMSFTLTAAAFWIMALIANIKMKIMFQILGEFATVCVFLLLCIATVVYTELLIPETRGKDSDSIVISIKRGFFYRRNTDAVTAQENV